MSLSRSPAMRSRSSSVRSPHHFLTSPRICFHFPLRTSAFILYISLFYKQRLKCRGLMRSEDRALIAPGTLCRVLHRTKGKMCARPPGYSLLPFLCGDAAQREYRDHCVMPSLLLPVFVP